MTVALNTLFVTTEGAALFKDHETVVVKVEEKTRVQVPLLHLSGVVCLTRAYVSPDLLAACSEAGIFVSFLSPTGRLLARIEGIPGGNVLLRRQQYRVADDAARSLLVARSMVIGKVANARRFLANARRDAAAERQPLLADAVDKLARHLAALPDANSVESVRGLEGIAARDYFAVFSLLLKVRTQSKRDSDGPGCAEDLEQPGAAAFVFNGRSRRPPRDRVNCLLSFGYALLMQDCAGAAAGIGLDPAVGFLHEDRPGRLALALDLMEELRVPVVDRLTLALINRGQLLADDFVQDAGGGWKLTDDARKKVLVAYQEAKQVEVRHPFLEQNTMWGRVPHLQALLLARHLRGDLEVYPPFSIR